MNLDELRQKLLKTARSAPSSEAVPYAFEKRIAARIRSISAFDTVAQWAGGLWRAAVPCILLAVLLGAWSTWKPSSITPSTDLSQEIDNTLLAGIEQEQSLE